jgi:hypothetical protein
MLKYYAKKQRKKRTDFILQNICQEKYQKIHKKNK